MQYLHQLPSLLSVVLKNLLKLSIRLRVRLELDAFNSILPFSHCEPRFDCYP